MPRDRAKAKEFVAYGTPVDGPPDPLLATIHSLRQQLIEMTARIEGLEQRQQAQQQDDMRQGPKPRLSARNS